MFLWLYVIANANYLIYIARAIAFFMKKYFFLIKSMIDCNIVGSRRNKYKLKSEGVN